MISSAKVALFVMFIATAVLVPGVTMKVEIPVTPKFRFEYGAT